MIRRFIQTLMVQNVRSYAIGFVASVLLTFLAYIVTTQKIIRGDLLGIVLMILAIVQVAIHLVLFLHLGEEKKPRWNLLVLLFMVTVALIVVVGSIWIMYHLDYNTMFPN